MIDYKNVIPLDKDTIQYYRYTIKRNGSIKNEKGRELKRYNLAYPYSHVTLLINGKKKKRVVARLIYALFYELDTGKTVSDKTTLLFFKDNNSQNTNYDNLEVVSRREGLLRKGNLVKRDDNGDFMRNFTLQEAEEIRRRYHAKQDDNKNLNQYKKVSPSIRELAKEYHCSVGLISKILKGDY